MTMRVGLAIASAALITSVAAASAADLGVVPALYAKAAPVVAPIYNWGGLYIGLNGGGGAARKCWDLTNNLGVVVSPAVAEGCHDATGGTVGGQIGYRWQAGTWVFGLEGQGNWADFSGSNANSFFTGVTDHSQVDAFWLLTGQVGYAWNNVLWYVKGGAAGVRDKYDTVRVATGAIIDSARETRWGGTVGTGVEIAFAPGWSVGVEYDHMFMGDRDVNAVTIAGVFSATDHIRQDVDIGTVRVNYRFGGPVY